MEQKSTTTTPPPTPVWVEDMKTWQQENKEQRAVLCIAVDGSSSSNTLFGGSLPLTAALLAVMLDNPSWANICRGALTAKDNPLAAIALVSALEQSKKDPSEPSEKSDSPDPSLRDSLKTILSKLADKL